MKTSPEINGLDLAGVRLAINLAELNLDSVRPDYRAALESRLAHLRDRERRLTATDQRIAAIQGRR